MIEKPEISNNFKLAMAVLAMLFDGASLVLIIAIFFKVAEGFIKIISAATSIN
jgi:hypothetical protein